MTTAIKVVEVCIEQLPEFGRIPIRFDVKSVFRVHGNDPRTASLVEEDADPPWSKDYDTVVGDRPSDWPKRWDISEWGLVAAYLEDQHAGGCVLALSTDGFNLLEGRGDAAALWDLRVHPDFRGRGIGSALFSGAVAWARDRSRTKLRIETQDVNVPACRFYKAKGCNLSSIVENAYDQCPGETQLIWELSI